MPGPDVYVALRDVQEVQADPVVGARELFAGEVARSEGDIETQNALDLLIGRAQDYALAMSIGMTGQPSIDASRGFLDGISAFAKRCKAVGSSALQ